MAGDNTMCIDVMENITMQNIAIPMATRVAGTTTETVRGMPWDVETWLEASLSRIIRAKAPKLSSLSHTLCFEQSLLLR